MNDVANLLDQLGRQTVRDRLGVSSAALSNAVRDGVMPSRWYLVVSVLCGETGCECPQHLFAFADDQKSVEDAIGFNSVGDAA